MADADERRTTLRTTDSVAERSAAAGGLARGTSIGRYVVLDRIGEGGTGEVLRAYDPELDRKVALKLLHASSDAPGDRARLLAEARALAKLHHPAIVAVHDVGLHEGRVFMTMAYVEGVDLAAWLQRPRARDEILDVLAGVARGLAAAHAAGLVHGDVKPSNVLVTEQHAVFVVDFGLAAPLARADVAESTPAGTPVYLAPELYGGGSRDAKSDLFAFATLVFEALVGRAPWSGTDEHELLLAKHRGPPPLPAAVPVPLRATLRRALQADPALRPDLDALQAALRRASRRRWPFALAAVAIAATIGAAVIASARPTCPSATSRTDEVWNAGTRAAARDGVLASGASHAAQTWEIVERRLDDYADAWLVAHREACEATHVRREQSPELLERVHACLDRRLHQLGVLADLLAQGDRGVVDEAARAAARLPRIADCDRASVLAAPPEPSGPEAGRIRAELDRIEVLESVAAYDDALAAARALAPVAQPFAVLDLEARYRIGRLLDTTGDHDAALDTLQRVHWEAEAIDADTLAALAGIYVVYELAGVMKRPDDALGWAPHVRAAIERAGGDPLQLAALDENVGVAHLYRQEYERALELFRATLEDRERAAPNDVLPLVSSLNNLGIALEETHRYDEAIAVQQRALAIVSAQVGPQHPHTARVHDNLGTALLRSGRIADALAHFDTALAIRRTAFGEEHRSVGMSYLHLGLAAVQAEQWPQAVAHYERSLAIFTARSPAADRDVLTVHEGLAHAYAGHGDRRAAIEHGEIALRGLEPLLGPDHPEIAALRELLADARGPGVEGR